ncbi:hypothetical protein HJC23_000181 [Cyclotella cryptica]|uniref:Uncharacterized protein n=1 Tax=Cyclotella cryptica TaxID=29204 RepID=A0ABD3QD21_9STRA|eukprot:CCRYP_006365-RA/>CCRYP_006365-RA protein AED:0.36 eAED:0.36 QI:0/-1/0/1/-1/1/1/0/122
MNLKKTPFNRSTMGSSQSQPSPISDPNPPSSDSTSSQQSRSNPPANESGFARAQRKCRKKKLLYDACYTAQLSSKDEDCGELFDAYRTCFLKVMRNDMERRGVKVTGGSMIGEFVEETEGDT